VKWGELFEKQYDAIVSMLLVDLYPTAKHVDGAGGDGGRDVQVMDAEGLHIFQLKSFSGRMTGSRRRQVERSLIRAKGLSPRDWMLIAPIDFNPSELAWFETLRRLVDFSIDFHDLTWLDKQMSSRPHIHRYVVEDITHEVVRIAELLKGGQAVLDHGPPEILERAQELRRLLDDGTPGYRFEITVAEGHQSLKLIPRYEGAERDFPITGSFKFTFPNDEAGRDAAAEFQRSVDFGTPVNVSSEYVAEVTVNVPANLGGTWSEAHVEIGPALSEGAKGTFVMTCESETGERLVELPLDFERSSQGQAGSIWKGADTTGTLSATLEFNVATGALTVNLNVKTLEKYYPHEVLPAFRFLEAFVYPNQFVLRTENDEHLSDLTAAPVEGWINPLMLPLVEGQALIQAAAKRLRRVRSGATREEIRDVHVAATLLRSGTVSGTWTHLTMELQEDVSIESEDKEHQIELLRNEPHTVTFDGYTYSVGTGTRIDAMGRIVGVLRRDEETMSIDPIPSDFLAAGVIPAGTNVVFEAGGSNSLEMRLLSDEH